MADQAKTKPSQAKEQKPEGENKTNKPYNKEEHKGEKPQYKHKSQHFSREKVIVTLETEIPELPKKNETLPRPDDDVFQTELDKIQKDIDDTYKKMGDVARESRNKNYFPADKTFEDLVSLLKVKQDERKKAYNEMQAINTEREMYKKQVDEYYEKGNDYRFKMKIPGRKQDLESRLKELKHMQSKGNISLQEEKKLIKEISDLERSLPHAGPLEELEEQSKEVKELLRDIKQKSNLKFEALKLLREECKDIQDKLDKIRDEQEKKKEENIPAIDKMKDEYRTKIDALKQKRKERVNKQNEAWRKYEEQQNEIERIKAMKRRKDKLIRDDIRRKRDEERRKQREAEEAEQKEIPYLPQIELCELLIKYCQRIGPSNDQGNVAVEQKDKNTVIKEALESDEWKQAKGQYILSRKEQTDDFFSGKGKKQKKKPQNAKNQEEESGAQSLNHQIETLNYFEEIKVSPPLFTDKLPETLKILQEKKAYFEKLSEEALKTEEERKNLPEEERKKLAEEEKQKRQEEQQSKKEGKRVQHKKKFDVESEQDFPKM